MIGVTVLKQQSIIDMNKIKSNLSEMLDIDIKHVTSELQIEKYSDIYKIHVEDSNKRMSSFILKDSDPPDFEFYKDILEPYNLDSPKMYGHIEVDNRTLLVMDYIPHETSDRESEQKYKRAIDWLIKKDSILSKGLNRIGYLPCIRSDIWGPDQWLDLVHRGVEAKVHPLLTKRFLEKLKNKFLKIINKLKEGKQTICHNDFHIYNILFGEKKRAAEISVIDWTLPNIGSVCVDLARLIYYAPNPIKSDLLERYRSQIHFKGIEENYYLCIKEMEFKFNNRNRDLRCIIRWILKYS